jgi:hypothetical protein
MTGGGTVTAVEMGAAGEEDDVEVEKETEGESEEGEGWEEEEEEEATELGGADACELATGATAVFLLFFPFRGLVRGGMIAFRAPVVRMSNSDSSRRRPSKNKNRHGRNDKNASRPSTTQDEREVSKML